MGNAPGSDQAAKKPNMSKTQMKEELEKLRSENQQLKFENDLLLNENQKISDIKNQVSALREENERLNNDIKSLETKIAWQNVEKEELEKKLSISNEQGDGDTLKIKVLTGDGNPASAKEMSDRLKQLGYQVKAIDRASRTTFVKNTVYFAPASRNEAEALVARLNGEAVLKPLTWTSVFDIIVVTGNSDYGK
jgi:predicted nuclease with TOPRIM domain